jgi:hypothetical protein
MSVLPTAVAVLQSLPAPDALAGSPLGSLLVALVVVALVVFVGRFVLSVAWRLVRIAIVLVGVAWLLSVFVPGLL